MDKHPFEPRKDMSNVLREIRLSPGNYYGNLVAVMTQDAYGYEYYWWAVENWDGFNWDQISRELFEELDHHEGTPCA
jgi:hypothetical protein